MTEMYEVDYLTVLRSSEDVINAVLLCRVVTGGTK